MNPGRLVLSVFLLLVALFAPAAELPPELLRQGHAVEREISGGRRDFFDLTLAEGELASVIVEQRGIDVIVSVVDSAGTSITSTNDECRVTGVERATIVADSSGTQRLSIQARYPRVAPGRYAVTLESIRAASEKDRALFEAEKLLRSSSDLNTKGKMDDAVATADQATALAEKTLGENDPRLTRFLFAQANMKRLRGRYAESRLIFERALRLSEQFLGRKDPQTTEIMSTFALTLMSENDYAGAERMLQEALELTRQELGPDHPRLAQRHQYLAILYQDLDDTRAAVAELENALRIAERSVDPESFDFIALVNNVGTLYRELGDHERARPLLERSLAMVEKLFGPAHSFVATPLQELAIIERETGNYDQALHLLWRAESARESSLGLRHQRTLGSLIVIANVYRARGEYEKAIDLQQRVLSILEEIAGPYHSLTLLTLSNLTRAYAAKGDVACAIEFGARADAVQEKNLSLKLAIGSERQKLAYAESVSFSTERAITLHIQESPGDTAAAAHALTLLLQRKGRVLDALSENLKTLRQQLGEEGRAELDRFETTIADLAKVALDGPGKTPLEEYRVRLAVLEKEKEELEAKISALSGAFSAAHRPVTLHDVREALPADAALIELAVYRPFDSKAPNDLTESGEPRYVAYVLRRSGRVLWKDLGRADVVDALVAKWRAALRNPRSSDVDRHGRALHQMVMRPLLELTGDATHLLIGVDGQLGLVPFEAMLDEKGCYLIERYTISYLGSGRDLLAMGVPRPQQKPGVIVADPSFGEPAVASSAARRDAASVESAMYFGPLAGTREEARNIHQLFPEATLLTGAEASKRALRELDAPGILHVATHGFFLDYAGNDEPHGEQVAGTRSVSARIATANPLLRSGLAFSGANVGGDRGDDGVLTALEASTLNLWGTRLVTLSACDSGVGEVKNQEGVYGLRRAFLLAGAESVVMSLWPVSDYVTRKTMTEFYAALKRGAGRAEALREARLAMLRRGNRRHPFYWASFIQSGDWRSLEH